MEICALTMCLDFHSSAHRLNLLYIVIADYASFNNQLLEKDDETFNTVKDIWIFRTSAHQLRTMNKP